MARCYGFGLVALIGRHTVSPALPLEVETSPGEITKVAVHYFYLQDLHTVVQLLHSSGQVILVNALGRRRGADLDSTCFSVVVQVQVQDTGCNTLVQFARCELQLAGC